MQVKASGTDHVFGAAHRRRLDVLEQQRDLLKNAQVRLVGRERVELAEKFEQRPDALRLVTRVEDQDADLAPVLQGLEPFEGRVEIAPAATMQVERLSSSPLNWVRYAVFKLLQRCQIREDPCCGRRTKP